VTGVQGTQFYVSYDPTSKQSVTKVYKGNVTVTGASGTVNLKAGEKVTTAQSGNGAVAEFDQSKDETPFSSSGAACCAPAAIVVAVAGIIYSAGRRRA
jgi:outer membrane protease